MRWGIEFFSSAVHRPWEADAYWWQVIQDMAALSGQAEIICLTHQAATQPSPGWRQRQVSAVVHRWAPFLFYRWWKQQQPACVFAVHRPAGLPRWRAGVGGQIPCILYVSPDDGYPGNGLSLHTKGFQQLWEKLHGRKHLVICPFPIASHWISSLHHVNLYPVPEAIFQPCSWEAEQQRRMQFAAGHPYFLSTAVPVQDPKRVVTWLKAFSVLKKRLQSSVKWIWVLDRRQFLQAERILLGYAFRQDVLLHDVEEPATLAAITSSAYAYLAIGPMRLQWRMILASLYSEVPVMAVAHPAYQALAEPAGLWISQEDVEIIAAHWLRLYQDEYLRKKLVQACQQQRGFTYDSFLHTLLSHVQSMQAPPTP
ncbi:MAG: glycosyltransferase [Thermoflavifilum sp.]|nr:glycosyltransferase [Thermoflavifilum sp.]